jgi:protein-disulfide isomerase
MYDKTVHQAVEESSREGDARYKIPGTPTIIINGRAFPGVPRDIDDLAAMIDPLLAR